MDKFKNYIMMITAFILTGSLLMAMIPKGAVKNTVKFVISAILMGIVLSPVSKLKDFDINLYTDEYTINNEAVKRYDEYAAEKVKSAVCGAVADFAKKKNININDTEVTTENGKIKSIIIDKRLAADISEISDILGVPQEYIETSE